MVATGYQIWLLSKLAQKVTYFGALSSLLETINFELKFSLKISQGIGSVFQEKHWWALSSDTQKHPISLLELARDITFAPYDSICCGMYIANTIIESKTALH